MKAIIDTISLGKMIANDGLKNGSLDETYEYVKQHFEHTNFENDLIKEHFKSLIYRIIDMRTALDYNK
jgi:hypothetical protein